jgi:hypothetical protein
LFECYEEWGDRAQFPKTLKALGKYGAKKLKYPEDLQTLFQEEMTRPQLIEPGEFDENATRREEIIWTTSMKSYARRSEELKSNLITLNAVIWGNATKPCGTSYVLWSSTKLRAKLATVPGSSRK